MPSRQHACSSVARHPPKPTVPSSVVIRRSGTLTCSPWGPRRALLPAERGRVPSNTPHATLTIREPSMAYPLRLVVVH
jgi:hypothetical protein